MTAVYILGKLWYELVTKKQENGSCVMGSGEEFVWVIRVWLSPTCTEKIILLSFDEARKLVGLHNRGVVT